MFNYHLPSFFVIFVCFIMMLMMMITRTCSVFFQIGRQHQKQILFCECEKDSITLIRLKLWPGSATRPSLAFHFKMMELAETLLLECHVSLRKFCDALKIWTKCSSLPLWVSIHFNCVKRNTCVPSFCVANKGVLPPSQYFSHIGLYL